MPPIRGRPHFIENAGPNSVEAALRTQLSRARSADIQVAFATASGVRRLLPRLRQVAGRGQARVLVGLYQCFTEPRALRELLQAQVQSGSRLQVRLATDTTFHRKVYVARTSRLMTVIIGSSNLTDGGLLGSGELNMLLPLGDVSQEARRLRTIIDASWQRGVPLTRAGIDLYEPHARKLPRRALPASVIRQILGSGAGRSRADALDPGRPGRFWLDYITRYASKQTEAVISEETNWDRRGWAWYGSRTPAIGKNDGIVLIDRSDPHGWVSVVQVEDAQPMPESTPDGRHFVAYKQVRRTSRRRPGRSLTNALKQAGVRVVDGSRIRLSQDVWNRVYQLFSRRR